MPFSCQVIGGADSERATILRALRECGCALPEGDAPADLVVRLSASEPPPRVRDWLLEGGPLVLALLPREDPETAAIALASGADDFLIWPRDKPLLRARLAVLERRRDNRRMRRESERRAAEEQVREADERYRLLFANVPDPIVVIEPTTARVLEVNDAFCRVYGWSVAEARELTVWDVAANPDTARQLLRAALERGAVGGAQRWTRGKDGTRILAELNVVRFRMGGRDLLCAVGRDVSERHRLAQELVLRDRLASVGTLAAGAAHEINNPLAYLFSNLTFVEEEVARAAPALRESNVDGAELLRALGEARQGAERIRDTVRDLKTFARPGLAGRGRVDVRLVLEAVLRMAGSELRERAHLVAALEAVPLVEGLA